VLANCFCIVTKEPCLAMLWPPEFVVLPKGVYDSCLPQYTRCFPERAINHSSLESRSISSDTKKSVFNWDSADSWVGRCPKHSPFDSTGIGRWQGSKGVLTSSWVKFCSIQGGRWYRMRRWNAMIPQIMEELAIFISNPFPLEMMMRQDRSQMEIKTGLGFDEVETILS
jgi:hypothetical protein